MKKDHKKKRVQNFFINFLLLSLLLIGLVLVFNQQIRNWVIGGLSQEHTTSKLTLKKIAENKKKNVSFDFDRVKAIDSASVADAKLGNHDYAVIGGIAIPNVHLNLPILKGVDNASLIVGAGTMKKNQEMGKGNYALAGHHMIDKEKLFSPIINIQLGDKIYLTDLAYIYVYQTVRTEYISKNQGDIIFDVPGKTLVTLITCDDTGAGRFAVQGVFVEKQEISQASDAIRQAFGLPVSNYEEIR